MKRIAIIPLISIAALSACVPGDIINPCTATAAQLRDCIDKVRRGELRAEDCACNAPTASILAAEVDHGDKMPSARPTKPEKPDGGDKIVDDSDMFDGKDPDRGNREPARGNYSSEEAYRDAHDAWRGSRG